MDTGLLLLVLLAVIVARMADLGLLKGSESEARTEVSAVVNSPAVPITVYTSAIDEYIAKNHPDARR